jgi:hypothetical protein
VKPANIVIPATNHPRCDTLSKVFWGALDGENRNLDVFDSFGEPFVIQWISQDWTKIARFEHSYCSEQHFRLGAVAQSTYPPRNQPPRRTISTFPAGISSAPHRTLLDFIVLCFLSPFFASFTRPPLQKQQSWTVFSHLGRWAPPRYPIPARFISGIRFPDPNFDKTT